MVKIELPEKVIIRPNRPKIEVCAGLVNALSKMLWYESDGVHYLKPDAEIRANAILDNYVRQWPEHERALVTTLEAYADWLKQVANGNRISF